MPQKRNCWVYTLRCVHGAPRPRRPTFSTTKTDPEVTSTKLGPTRACEPCWHSGRGCNVPGCGHRRCCSHCETDLGTATHIPRKAFVLLPRRYRSRSPGGPHPRGQLTR